MKKTMFKFLLVTLCLNTLATQTNASKFNHQTKTNFNVLFVGNSLTYSNNLPQLVSDYAATKGLTITTKTVAKGGYAIVDHWAEGRVQSLVRSNQYDFVIIQQGPSSQQDGYDMLVNDGAKYAQLCQDNNTQLAYYMVWPSIRYFHTFLGVIQNYTAGAEENNAILIPVGSAWKEYIDTTGDYSYYGPDGFHPSRKGSQKAAEVIVETLFVEPECICQNKTFPFN